MNRIKDIVGAIISSYLGPGKSNKVVIDGNEIQIVKCPLQLLQAADFESPFSSLLEENLNAHHEKFGCSTLTLLSMWYFWTNEFTRVLDDGYEVCQIVAHSQKILEYAISVIPEIVKKADDMILSKDISKKTEMPALFQTLKNFGISKKQTSFSGSKTNSSLYGSYVPSSICYSSRHFSPFLHNREDCVNNTSNSISEACVPLRKALHVVNDKVVCDIVEGLSHDDSESAVLISKCWKQQIAADGQIKFKTDGIIICPITLPCCYSTVVDGLIVKANLNSFCGEELNIIENRKALVIKGSVTFEYVHLGFDPTASIIKKKTSVYSEKEAWISRCCNIISELQVNILLVRSGVDPAVINFCCSHSILLLLDIPWSTLKVFCQAANVSPCTYLINCDKKNIASNIIVKKWNLENGGPMDNKYYQLSSNNSTNVSLCTVVLCHPSPSILSSKEHMFWHLASRLILATESNQLLPGGGKTEEWCCKALNKLNNADAEARITSAIANGFDSFHKVIESKKDVAQDANFDVISKIHAWRSAMALVLLILQCDILLINGCDKSIKKQLQFGHEVSGFL